MKPVHNNKRKLQLKKHAIYNLSNSEQRRVYGGGNEEGMTIGCMSIHCDWITITSCACFPPSALCTIIL